MTGYKAATENILKKLSNAYNISGEELQSLRSVIGVPKDVSIPNMMLVPPSSGAQTPSKEDTNFSDQTNQQQQESNDNDYIEVEDSNNNNTELNPPSPTFSNKNLKHNTDLEQNTDQMGPILLSCMMQDPVTSKYHSALLPLNSILSAKEGPISMPRLYKQSKLAMETVITQKETINHDENMKRSVSAKHKPDFSMNNIGEEVFSQAIPVKRRYSDDRQVPVITGSMKRPPKLLYEEFITNRSKPVPLPSHFSVRNGGVSAQPNETFNKMTRYDINTTIEMATKEFQTIYPPSFSRGHSTSRNDLSSSRNHSKSEWMVDVEKESPREKFW